MAVLRFTTTHLSGLQAAGRIGELQHSTIAPFLERELGPVYGELFAEFEAEGPDVRAWYVDADKRPRAMAELTTAEQDALRRRTADMIKTILDFSSRIATESPQRANLARILTAATTFPIEDVWALGEQPLIVNWGFHRQDVPVGTPRAILELIRVRPPISTSKPKEAPVVVPPAPAPAPAAAPAVRREPMSTAWVAPLLWFVFAGLVATADSLLLPACGLRGPVLANIGLLNACPVPVQADRLTMEANELQGLVDQAELDLARRKLQCEPTEKHAQNLPRPSLWSRARQVAAVQPRRDGATDLSPLPAP